MTPARNAPRSLDDRYTLLEGEIYLSGVQALVRLPLDVHRTDLRRGQDTALFISGYEGSPLGGYDLELSKHQALLDEHRVCFRPGLNEELAANAVQGTQLALTRPNPRVQGVTGFWYGKAPGLDRATDAIRHSNLSGTHPTGGVVAFVGDDTLAKSSTVPSSSEMALAELSVPTLVPADAQDVLELGLHAVAMSRLSGLWTGFKIATNVADGTCTAQVGHDRVVPVQPDLTFDGEVYQHKVTGHLIQPVLGVLEHNMIHRRLVLARRYARANRLNRVADPAPEASVGIIAAGATFLDVCQALQKLGVTDTARRGVRLLRLGMVWPLDPDTVHEFARGLREIVVVEEKRSFIEAGVKEILYTRADRPLVSGKTAPDGSPLLRPEADLGPDLIASALAQRLSAHAVPVRIPTESATHGAPLRPVLPLAMRTPFFCSGCPHNRSTQVPAESLVGAGIGCHGMAALMPAAKVGDVIGLTQMGGEGAVWIGMSEYVRDNHLFQNIGDGTFHHSGSLAVRAAVAAGVNVTFKLLYNSAVAMTGGQHAVGQLSVPSLARLMLAEGVKQIVVTTDEPQRYSKSSLPKGVKVRHRDELLDVQKQLAEVPGVTLLIHDQECATELRRRRKRKLVEPPSARPFINERVCEGCGDCGAKSNCLSVQPVETEFGRKTRIHQPSCNQDMSCLDGDCPAFLTVTPGKRATSRPQPAVIDTGAFPTPTPTDRVESATFGLRITGIGGTGVVTVAQILAAAARMDGFQVRALDQTGLAQKGGAVVSDVKLSPTAFDAASKLAADECDLYLGCDLLVASSPVNLAACSPTRTAAVVSTAEIPTGAMVINPLVSFPAQQSVVDQIASRANADASVYVDAHRLTREIFADDQFANIFLVGVAYQAGLLPVSSDSIEAAISLNGVAVSTNVQAFRCGRQYVADPTKLFNATNSTEEAETTSWGTAHPVAGDTDEALEDLIQHRYSELAAYQNGQYADRYLTGVKNIRAVEARETPGETALTAAVARHLFKLMAYKDEYEVARLSRDPQFLQGLREQFGQDVRYAFRLHPPVLRALGMRHKLSLGPWFRHIFALLYGARRLRGTRLDPFGYAHVRRVERTLVVEYEDLLDEVARRLSRTNHRVAVELASAPDMVRGYEQVKLANVDKYRARVGELRSQLAESDLNLSRGLPQLSGERPS